MNGYLISMLVLWILSAILTVAQVMMVLIWFNAQLGSSNFYFFLDSIRKYGSLGSAKYSKGEAMGPAGSCKTSWVAGLLTWVSSWVLPCLAQKQADIPQFLSKNHQKSLSHLMFTQFVQHLDLARWVVSAARARGCRPGPQHGTGWSDFTVHEPRSQRNAKKPIILEWEDLDETMVPRFPSKDRGVLPLFSFIWVRKKTYFLSDRS